MDFFTADTHFFHKKMAEIRGFSSAEEMNDRLVADWNDAVGNSDRVFVLGDLSFGRPVDTVLLMSRLKGQIFLVLGNHDSRKEAARNPYIAWVREAAFIKAPCGTGISLSHFPMLVWNKSHYGSWHLHGHSHGNLKLPAEMRGARIFDVGVDNAFERTGSYGPMSFDLIQIARGPVADFALDHHESGAR